MAHDKVRKTVEDAATRRKAAGSESIEGVKEEAREALGSAKDTVVTEIRARADAGRDFLADKAADAAERLRVRAAADATALRGRVLGIIASGASELARDLRRQSLPTLLAETEAFSRRHPGAFVAGAALAGFTLARFGRASGASGPATSATGGPDATAGNLGATVSDLHSSQDGA